MKQKWYLQTWFIVLLFMFWPYIIPMIIGALLMFMQYLDNRKRYSKTKEHITNPDDIEVPQSVESTVEWDTETFDDALDSNINNIVPSNLSLSSEYNNLFEEVNRLKFELAILNQKIQIAHYEFSDYESFSSEECKTQLALLRLKVKELIENDEAIKVKDFTKVNLSSGRRSLDDNKKQLLRCFNAEFNNILSNISARNIDSSRRKIVASFESLNKIFEVDGLKLNLQMLECKLEELNLVYTSQFKSD